MCGENLGQERLKLFHAGSSPRVRGKRDTVMVNVQLHGLIPACAGKTRAEAAHSVRAGAHPRVCGENGLTQAPMADGVGSSPRVRGKLMRYSSSAPTPGLIPACAGKTRSPAQKTSPWPGSSPRVRGKPIQSVTPQHGNRLIPACAGKTLACSSLTLVAGAHPRVCGENEAAVELFMAHAGSSPRVRGKRCLREGRPWRSGLIPACAGKTHTRRYATTREPAHPRVCGENRISCSTMTSALGSSPRVRGKRRGRNDCRDRCGLIPACAGKTIQISGCAGPLRAHPRVCGENPVY